jgi:hypothetical protein
MFDPGTCLDERGVREDSEKHPEHKFRHVKTFSQAQLALVLHVLCCTVRCAVGCDKLALECTEAGPQARRPVQAGLSVMHPGVQHSFARAR